MCTGVRGEGLRRWGIAVHKAYLIPRSLMCTGVRWGIKDVGNSCPSTRFNCSQGVCCINESVLLEHYHGGGH